MNTMRPKAPAVTTAYNNDDEESSDDNDDNWRDLSLGRGASSAPTQQQAYLDPTVSNGSRGTPDNYWLLPAHVNKKAILGANFSKRKNEIQQSTGSFIEFNASLNQIDIWGDATAIDKTKSFLDVLVARHQEQDTSTLRKTQKWSRPERELTPKEQRRAEKRAARLEEEKRYQGIPSTVMNYHASFPLPDQNLPISKLVGENESYLNQIRADTKSFLWYEPGSNTIRIGSETREGLSQGAQRIRNWFLRCNRKPEGGVLRLMHQPSKHCLLSFHKLPAGFVTYEYADPQREATMLEKHRLLESVITGQQVSLELISLDDVDSNTKLSERAQTLNERNKKDIDFVLSRGLESMRLNDWNLRLKVRFGQICLVDYPKKDNQFLEIDVVADKMFRKPKFKSALAPCISKTQAGLDTLFEYLTSTENAVEFSDNPRTSFTIQAKQYPTAAPIPLPGQRFPATTARGEMWDTILEIAFTEDGQRRLWNTMTDCKDLVDISCADIESHYSWDLRLQYARRLPNHDITSPHEKFSHELRVGANNRLILATSNDYQPQLVTQKTKWRYSWNEYVVEICKDEIWDMNRVERTDKELPVDLGPIEPHRSLFKVSMYKESWINRLAENLDLKIGEAPSWTLRDFFASNTEDTDKLMSTIKEFNDILNSEVPLYWNAEQSLV